MRVGGLIGGLLILSIGVEQWVEEEAKLVLCLVSVTSVSKILHFPVKKEWTLLIPTFSASDHVGLLPLKILGFYQFIVHFIIFD